MRLLLDSHVLLWWDKESSRLSETQRKAIQDSENRVFVSAATAWELGIKRAAGKLLITESVSDHTARLGFEELPVTMRHGEMAASLTLHHKDPFDRMLVAQALVEGMVLVTVDRRLREYAGLVVLG